MEQDSDSPEPKKLTNYFISDFESPIDNSQILDETITGDPKNPSPNPKTPNNQSQKYNLNNPFPQKQPQPIKSMNTAINTSINLSQPDNNLRFTAQPKPRKLLLGLLWVVSYRSLIVCNFGFRFIEILVCGLIYFFKGNGWIAAIEIGMLFGLVMLV
jgi:hypothetical protein